MKRLHVFAMLIMACFWVLSGVVQAQTKYYNIGNLVWNDLNKNGIQDPGEPGLPDIPVWLYSCGAELGTVSSSSVSFIDNMQPIKKTVTDLNGNYSFGGLGVGRYFVKVLVPDGWAVSPMFQGTSDEKDSDIFPYLWFTGMIVLTDDQTPNDRLSLDAGLFKPQACDLVTIGDMVFNDCNHNGVQDCDEKGIAGVRVKLYACDILPCDGEFDLGRASSRRHCRGLFLEEVVTDLTGHYLFEDVIPGEYCIEVCLPHGFKAVPRPNCPDVCNLDFETNTTGCMMFNACTKNLDIDFAVCNKENNCKLAAVGDLVWNDENGDGIQEMNESVMPGVTLTLYAACPGDSVMGPYEPNGFFHCTPMKVGTVKTDDKGKYLFANLIPGLYYIKVTTPFPYVVSRTNTHNPFQECNDNDFWRYYDGTTKVINRTGTFYLPVTDDPNLCIDAGLIYDHSLVATIGDFVWRDDDGDGVQDPREVGVPGVTIKLYECQDKHSPSYTTVETATYECSHSACGTKLVATTTTDENGYYAFENIPAGKKYCLKIVVPPCFTLSPYHKGNDYALNSDFHPKDANTRCIWAPITVPDLAPSGAVIDFIDAGLIPNSTTAGVVGDYVWNDVNKNGIQDCDEKGIECVKVQLYSCETDKLVAEIQTDKNGKYLFTNVPTVATYYVKFILPANYVFTAQDQGNSDDFDSDPCPEKGITANFTLGSGMSNMSIDAGMYQVSCSISDYVWDDTKTNNGKMDAEDIPMVGVKVELCTCENGEAIMSTTTDEKGKYTFTNVPEGKYNIKVTVPVGYVIINSDMSAQSVIGLCFDAKLDGSEFGKPVPLRTGVEGAYRAGIPTEFALSQNFPNPFNPSTTINFDIPAAGQYVMKVYNMLGQEVATLVNGELNVGYHSVTFDASKLTSGVYIYRLTGNNVVMTKKMMLNK
ncbi:MAG: SdrD B-like domain-containing protein [Acidobacteriota bacterium]